MLLFTQKVTQNKKYSYHVTYHTTPKSLEQFLQCLEYKKEANSVQDMIVLVVDQRSKHLSLMPLFPEAYSSHHNKKHVQESKVPNLQAFLSSNSFINLSYSKSCGKISEHFSLFSSPDVRIPKNAA